MREWGAEALTYLVKSALNCKEYNPPLAENPVRFFLFYYKFSYL